MRIDLQIQGACWSQHFCSLEDLDLPITNAEVRCSAQLRCGINFNKEWEDPAILNVQQVLFMAKILDQPKGTQFELPMRPVAQTLLEWEGLLNLSGRLLWLCVSSAT